MNQVNPRYTACLVAFMSYTHGVQYGRDDTFTQEQLLAITPQQVADWLCIKAFGMVNPGEDDLPTLCRSGTLEVYKKASLFLCQIGFQHGM